MTYGIWLIEYGFIDQFPASNLFAAQPNEGARRMPYCFGLVRSENRVILVDTGFFDPAITARLAVKYPGDATWIPPTEALERCGVAVADVDTVVLTHAHFDHAGCVDEFPHARVHIQRRELDALSTAAARGPRFEFLTRSSEPRLEERLRERAAPASVVLDDGPAEVAPGVTAVPAFDTHTAGSQVVLVDNETDGSWLFAGDNMYAYENVEGLHSDGVLAPIAMSTGSATIWLDVADDMLQRVGGDSRRILPFHESRVWEQFPSREFADGLHVAEVTRPPDSAFPALI